MINISEYEILNKNCRQWLASALAGGIVVAERIIASLLQVKLVCSLVVCNRVISKLDLFVKDNCRHFIG